MHETWKRSRRAPAPALIAPVFNHNFVQRFNHETLIVHVLPPSRASSCVQPWRWFGKRVSARCAPVLTVRANCFCAP